MADITMPLPCPFCGGQGIPLHETAEQYWLRCRSCAATGPWQKSATGALWWWNMRVPKEAANA